MPPVDELTASIRKDLMELSHHLDRLANDDEDSEALDLPGPAAYSPIQVKNTTL